MYGNVRCPKCGAFATERKSRSKGAKDRFRCRGKQWKRKNYIDDKLVSIAYGFAESCGLFGLKDLKKGE
ncbi:MAG TPA: hypothetical protein DCR57_10800 [Pasteurella multocida]|nr:hypothetical protein [Pasteurella multocida]